MAGGVAAVQTAAQIIETLLSPQAPPPTDAELIAILTEAGAAGFCRHAKRAQDWEKDDIEDFTGLVGSPRPGRTHLSFQAGEAIDSAEAHTWKRIKQKEWQPKTHPMQYVADLCGVFVQAEQRIRTPVGPPWTIHLGQRGYEFLAAVVVHLDQTCAPCPNAMYNPRKAELFVIYNATSRCIATGFPVESLKLKSRFNSWQKKVTLTR